MEGKNRFLTLSLSLLSAPVCTDNAVEWSAYTLLLYIDSFSKMSNSASKNLFLNFNAFGANKKKWSAIQGRETLS
jgi:hypothetical protein